MIAQIKSDIINLDAKGILEYLNLNFGEKVVFSTSFGLEDQVITHYLNEVGSKISLFTLDTGRLFPETYYVWNRTLERYGVKIKTYQPETNALQELVSQKGPSSFYESVENRKECCYIRKIEPLKRAIHGYSIWITGIRAAQSANRDQMERIEWDQGNNIIKIHPLFHWSDQELEKFVKANNIPRNPLHDKGYPSIGCQPCTRAVRTGEDIRSGRWWWEDKSKKECGLHVSLKQ